MQQITTEPFNDSSIMPFGMHKGKAMANIPAKYFLYLFDQGGPDHQQVKQYILESLDALKKEARRK